jgi:hypothetical protein
VIPDVGRSSHSTSLSWRLIAPAAHIPDIPICSAFERNIAHLSPFVNEFGVPGA